MILKRQKTETTKAIWKRVKRKIYERLMDMTGRPWEIKENHVLSGDNGYIENLIRQVQREG